MVSGSHHIEFADRLCFYSAARRRAPRPWPDPPAPSTLAPSLLLPRLPPLPRPVRWPSAPRHTDEMNSPIASASHDQAAHHCPGHRASDNRCAHSPVHTQTSSACIQKPTFFALSLPTMQCPSRPSRPPLLRSPRLRQQVRTQPHAHTQDIWMHTNPHAYPSSPTLQCPSPPSRPPLSRPRPCPRRQVRA